MASAKARPAHWKPATRVPRYPEPERQPDERSDVAAGRSFRCATRGCASSSVRAPDGADLTLVITAHAAIDWERVVARSARVFDTRNATRDIGAGREKIRKL